MNAVQTIVSFCILSLFTGCEGCSRPDQPKQEHVELVEFGDCFDWKAGFNKDTSTVIISMDIKEGYHAYGTKEETARPLGISILSANGWKTAGSPNIPAGKEKKLQIGKVFIVEGEVSLSQKVVDGLGNIEGSVQVQICTDTMCDRPKNLPFEISTQ